MEHLHVRLDHNLDVRKMLLEAALVSTEMLASFEDVDGLFTQQTALRKEWRKRTKGMLRDVGLLQKEFPDLPEEFIREELLGQHIVEPVGLSQQRGKKDGFEIPSRDRLQDEIVDIRKRLQKLGIR